MMIEYIRYNLQHHQPADLIGAYQQAGAFLQQSPYCLGYELTVCEEDPNSLIVRIMWTSGNDHLDGFRKSAQFRLFFPIVRPFVEEISEMRHYRPAAVHWRSLGSHHHDPVTPNGI